MQLTLVTKADSNHPLFPIKQLDKQWSFYQAHKFTSLILFRYSLISLGCCYFSAFRDIKNAPQIAHIHFLQNIANH